MLFVRADVLCVYVFGENLIYSIAILPIVKCIDSVMVLLTAYYINNTEMAYAIQRIYSGDSSEMRFMLDYIGTHVKYTPNDLLIANVPPIAMDSVIHIDAEIDRNSGHIYDTRDVALCVPGHRGPLTACIRLPLSVQRLNNTLKYVARYTFAALRSASYPHLVYATS